MNSSFKYVSILALASTLATSFLCAQEDRPNVLFISVDDLNDWVGVYGGHPQAKTPHIDRFAQQAMVFRLFSKPHLLKSFFMRFETKELIPYATKEMPVNRTMVKKF